MIFDSIGQGSPATEGSSCRRQNSFPNIKSGGAELRKDEARKSESFRRKRMELRRIRRLSREKSDGDLLISTDYGVCLKKKRCAVETEAKSTEKGVGLRDLKRLSHGTISVIGRRREMEDAVAVELGFLKKGGKSYDFFGVYDGHGGWRVAEACSEMMHKLVRETVEEESGGDQEIDWGKVMVDAFKRMDEEVNKEGALVETTGSTAAVAVVGAEEIVVANCGDSRAVISRGGVAVQLSDDHKPDRPDELERIEDSGGRVINWNGQRVLGVLATSRSIGDQYLKPYVITEPEVKVINRTYQDEFLVLASDGLWDVVSNDLVCQVVKRCLDGRLRCSELEMVQYAVKENTPFEKMVNGSLAVEAAAALAELAMARGSRDNISVTVVVLNQAR